MEKVVNFNPHLKPWLAPQPNNVAGKGVIEKPGETENFVWQTRKAEPTQYENDFGDALENVCPHAYALLTQGFVDGDTVECPLHEAVFHIPTGKCLKEPGGRDLKMYSVRLAGEEIQIKVA